MLDQAILNYVRDNLSSGYTEDQIRQGLLAAGFDDFTITQAIDQIRQEYVQGGGNQDPAQQQAQQGTQQQGQQTDQMQGQDAPGGQSKGLGSNNFKTVFIGIASIVGFLLIAGFIMVLIPRGSSADDASFNDEDLTEPTDAFDDFPGEPGIDDPVDDSIDDPVDDTNDTGLDDPFEDSPPDGDPAMPDPEDDSPSDGLQCRLGVSTRNVVVSIGQNRGLIAHGNRGEDTEVRWRSDDTAVAEINPSSSRYTVVRGISEGQTRVTATDEAVGEDCSYTVVVTVTE